MNKKLYIGKRNYIVDVLLVGGNDLNMSYFCLFLPSGQVLKCPRAQPEDILKPVQRGGIDILTNDRNLMYSDSEMHFC